MRLYEIQTLCEYDNDDLLMEGWLESIKGAVGSRIDQTVSVVNNTTTALQVFFKIGSNEEYLETMTYLIKKNIKTNLKALGQGPVIDKFVAFISRIFPQGRKLLDFLKACVLNAVIQFVGGIVEKIGNIKGAMIDSAKGEAQEVVTTLINKMVNLDSMIGGMSQASGIFTIMKTIGVANEYLFELLNQLNKKIAENV